MSLDTPLQSISLHLYRDRDGRWRASVGDPGARVAFGPYDGITTLLTTVGGAIATSVHTGCPITAPVRRHARTRFDMFPILKGKSAK